MSCSIWTASPTFPGQPSESQGKILCSQLKKNKELYLELPKGGRSGADELHDECGFAAQILSFIKPSVLCRHAQKRCGYKGTDRGKGPETQTLIDYLYGRVPFSALYPYEEQMAKNSHFYRGYRLRNLLDGFPAKDEDREFFNRCQACTFLRQEGYFMSSGKNPFYQPKEEAFAGFLKTWKKREWMRRIC